jgi:acetate kinase
MKILVLNSGSSSVKYQMIEPETRTFLARGVVEEVRLSGEILDHKVAIEYVLSILLSKNHGVIKDKNEISAVGHRVVHGGESFSSSVLITSDVIKEISRCMDYAPLHNPPNLKGIRATQALLPDVPQVAVFDTAFHQTMQENA